MAVDTSSAPTTPQAKLLDTGFMPSWSMLAADDLEKNELLKFPQSIQSYSAMLTEAQIQGLFHGTTWPIFRMRWYIDPGRANAEWVDRYSQDIGLPILDDDLPPRRNRNRFKFLEHLEQALEAVALGFQTCEQQVEYADPADGGDGFLHLRKLLPIPPISIAEMKLGEDGGMEWIKQQGFQAPEISINRLVWYAFQKRGANWTGRSLFRGAYGAWLLKDRALRVGVMNLQRAGVGTPVIEAHPGATETELIIMNRMAERFKAGEKTGGALPAGAKLRLVGVEGSQPDAVGFAKLMNEEMARSFLQMFMILGQSETGSRSLGGDFIDWHKLTLEYIANWFMTIFNEHVTEDIWDWNYGEDIEDVPAVRWEWDEKTAAGAQAAQNPAADLQNRIAKGQVQVDDQTAAVVGSQPTGSARRSADWRRSWGGNATRAAGLGNASLPLPVRTLRRQLYDHEITAAVDFNALDTAYQSALDLLVMEIQQLQSYQIAELHDLIIDAKGDMSVLGELAATPQHRDAILSRLRQVADIAAQQHVEEARRQGVDIARPNTEELLAGLLNRSDAVDNILTRDLSTSAARNAIRLSGGTLTAVEVADAVRDDLRGRSDAYLREVLGGATQQAINDGRGLVMRRANPEHIYASELLDHATCSPCVGRDGTQYMSMEDAARDYPSGGYKDCLGRDKCRGVLVAVYAETEATL